MKITKFPMWIQGRKIPLYEILDRLVLNREPEWLLYEIEYIGSAPGELSVLDFERLVRESTAGYFLSSGDLVGLARNMRDLDNLDLRGNYEGHRVVEIVAFDSSEWEIRVDGEIVELGELPQGS